MVRQRNAVKYSFAAVPHIFGTLINVYEREGRGAVEQLNVTEAGLQDCMVIAFTMSSATLFQL